MEFDQGILGTGLWTAIAIVAASIALVAVVTVVVAYSRRGSSPTAGSPPVPVPAGEVPSSVEQSRDQLSARLESIETDEVAALELPELGAKESVTLGTDAAETVDVDISVFAPGPVPPGQEFVVQAVLHRIGPDCEQSATDLAARLDPAAQRAAQVPLLSELAVDDRIELRLTSAELVIETPVRQTIWRGTEQAVVFIAKFPEGSAGKTALARLQVFCDSVPIGYAVFRVACLAANEQPTVAPVGGGAGVPTERVSIAKYRRAFLSYSSSDRLHVLRHNQLLALLGIEVFQDMVSINPGDTWDETLVEEIENSDLMLVYWSEAAAQSQWVRKEVEHALALRERRGNDVPDIVPVILEGPPVPLPPDSIGSIHFNDPLRYIIYVHEQQAE